MSKVIDGLKERAIHNVTYHRVRDDRQERMENIRAAAIGFINWIDEECDGIDMPRELSMAYRAVEDATMYAIAGIARHGEAGEEQEEWK